MNKEINRNRFLYIFLILIVMVLGISSRKFGEYIPEFLELYAGDTLWALMVYLCFAFIMKEKSIKIVGIFSLIFSFSIEFSQLYSADWINVIRNTTLGGLILGHGFLFSDLICYMVGIMLGVVIDIYFHKNNLHKN